MSKRQADEFAAGFAEVNGRKESEPEPLTLGRPFDIYGEEVTPTKAEASQRSDRVEVVGIACTQRLIGRAEKVFGNWTSPARSLERAKVPATGRRIRREIEGIERAYAAGTTA